jgi:peptidoglycan/xylan/chitin deacetylase (PgdA/CDA1 family)
MGRRGRTAAVVIVVAVLGAGVYVARSGQQASGNAGSNPTKAIKAGQTVVTLTFDDGTEDQYQAGAILAAHGGMDATFFVNSAVIGSNPSHMTWKQLKNLYADGNEIASHTMTHPHLTTSDPGEAGREICYDRNNLLAHGFPVTDFAYPYGEYDARTEAMVRDCGFNSARGTESVGKCPSPCAVSIPPPDRYATRVVGYAPDGPKSLEDKVTAAEKSGGGWVQIVYHGLCTSCGVNGTSPADFKSFLDWLQPRAAHGTVVRTVHDVIDGPVQDSVPGPALPPAPNATNGTTNPSLEQDANKDGIPDCYRINSWGNQRFNWKRSTDAHTGKYAERVDVSAYVDGADRLQTQDDLGYCTPTVTPGHQYRISAWYKSTAPVQLSTNTRDESFQIHPWRTSSSFPATTHWRKATWTTPPVADGTNGLIFALMISGDGSLTVDDFSIVDANPSR